MSRVTLRVHSVNREIKATLLAGSKPPEVFHPDLREFLARVAEIPETGSPQEQRRVWREFCLENNRPAPPGIQVRDETLSLAHGDVPLRWYLPESAQPQPLVVYLHGGGWVLGDLDTQDTIAWGIAEETSARVASVDYRLAPEHPYPAAFEDCYAVTEHLAANAQGLGIDPERIALFGDSAGGTLSAAVAHAARDRHGPAIAAQVLLYPVTHTDTTRDSYLENENAPLLTKSEMEHYLKAYLGAAVTDPGPYALPLFAEDFANLPPAFVHTAEFDPLRDEGHLYYRRLREAGNDAEYRCAESMPHGFIRARLDSEAAAMEFKAACYFLRRKLA